MSPTPEWDGGDHPENMKKLLADRKYYDMVRDDAFLELVMDCYAWMIWQFLRVPGKDGSTKASPEAGRITRAISRSGACAI